MCTRKNATWPGSAMATSTISPRWPGARWPARWRRAACFRPVRWAAAAWCAPATAWSWWPDSTASRCARPAWRWVAPRARWSHCHERRQPTPAPPRPPFTAKVSATAADLSVTGPHPSEHGPMNTTIPNNGLPKFTQTTGSAGNGPATTASGAADPASTAPKAGDQLKLTDSALALQEAARTNDSAVIDTARVERLRQALADGSYKVEAERTALDARDSDALDRAGTHKQALMLQLEQLDAERRQLAAEQPAVAAAAAAGWSRIVQRLQYCHLLNQRNG